jgi:hypothetical protein
VLSGGEQNTVFECEPVGEDFVALAHCGCPRIYRASRKQPINTVGGSWVSFTEDPPNGSAADLNAPGDFGFADTGAI